MTAAFFCTLFTYLYGYRGILYTNTLASQTIQYNLIMYALTITNNYVWQISADNGSVRIDERGGTHTFEKLGNLSLDIPGMGQMAFIDLGDKKIPGYPIAKETWGVLVRGANVEAYYRYEGGGALNLTIDAYGTATLTTSNGTLISISLEELIVVDSGIPTN